MANRRAVGGFAGAVIALCFAFVAHMEGVQHSTYTDLAGVPTICYGHTGQDVTPDRTASESECGALLYGDIADAYAGVLRCTEKPLTTHQAAALTSFTYNVGVSAYCRSTMARMINAGQPPDVWCDQLRRWVYAGNRVVPGLVKRRAAEYSMCMGQINELPSD